MNSGIKEPFPPIHSLRRFLTHSLTHSPDLIDVDGIPAKEKEAQERTDKDADDEIAVEVHGEQHDEIRHAELEHVKQSSDGLLTKCQVDVHGLT